jgi:hypothetical protein
MQTSTTPPAAGAQVLDDLLPLSHVAVELGLSYHAARDLALRGRLKVRFIGHRIWVTAESLAALKGEAPQCSPS